MAATAAKTTVSSTTTAKNSNDEDWRQGYLDLCEQEVKTKTGIQFFTRDVEGRPALEYTFGLGTRWTSGKPTIFILGFRAGDALLV